MAYSLNTARALLEAKNFDGARRLVNEILEKKPDDISCWNLRIKIESEAENYKEALRICRDVLRQHPENVILREWEFDALAHLRRKREAKKVLEKFKADFPDHYGRIENMQFCLDALRGKTQKLSKYLENLGDNDLDPEEKLNLGLFYHKTCNVFRAQQYMVDAHPFYPDNFELNKTLAQNSLQLGKLATARKFAHLALRLSPGDRHMRALIAVSYIYYMPQFYLLNAVVMLVNLANSYFGLLLAVPFMLFVGIVGFEAHIFIIKIINIFLNFELLNGRYLFYGFLFSYFFIQYPDYFKFVYERKKEVKLKRY
ncbi:hypothetical protein [uncultured Roseibium sp.]|uniref:hypothetical protein n=1 Tax=uncultured Roseibium sp. TaxID=1936171 RepID=UPI00260B7287|nr:hypothetical protein [uncultured Roseibium sp.]